MADFRRFSSWSAKYSESVDKEELTKKMKFAMKTQIWTPPHTFFTTIEAVSHNLDSVETLLASFENERDIL